METPSDRALTTQSYLTNEEAQFVYNVEVLGLPTKKAADLAGLSYKVALQPHIVQAREATKREIRGNVALTKEDVVFGVQDAIGRAKILAEPATEIRGWEVISKMLGFDAPARIDINMRESITVVQQQMRSTPTDELVKMLGAGNVIDADFYVTEAK